MDGQITVPSIGLGAGLTTTLVISVTAAPDAPVGTVEACVITAASRLDPTVFGVATDTTRVVPLSTPRIINPGFEGGLGQSAWQTSMPDPAQIFVHHDDLPPLSSPTAASGWPSWPDPRESRHGAPTHWPSALPRPSPRSSPCPPPSPPPHCPWPGTGHDRDITAPVSDTLTVSVFDADGALLTTLLTVTNATSSPPGGAWQEETIRPGPLPGRTVQIAFQAVASETTFYVDDVNLTTEGPPGPPEFRALWVDAYHDGIKSRQQIDELIETARAGSFNALVVQVRRRGDTYYPSALDPWAPDADPTFDALAYPHQAGPRRRY